MLDVEQHNKERNMVSGKWKRVTDEKEIQTVLSVTLIIKTKNQRN